MYVQMLAQWQQIQQHDRTTKTTQKKRRLHHGGSNEEEEEEEDDEEEDEEEEEPPCMEDVEAWLRTRQEDVGPGGRGGTLKALKMKYPSMQLISELPPIKHAFLINKILEMGVPNEGRCVGRRRGSKKSAQVLYLQQIHGIYMHAYIHNKGFYPCPSHRR